MEEEDLGKCVPECPDAPSYHEESGLCVKQCQETHDENMVCRTCEAMYKELPYWDGEKCIARCVRTTLINGREFCVDADTCPAGLKLSTDEKSCVERCDLWVLDKTTGEQ